MIIISNWYLGKKSSNFCYPILALKHRRDGATGIVFSGCYSIYLFNRISYGAYSPHLKPYKDEGSSE
jgi:hypothetical protein